MTILSLRPSEIRYSQDSIAYYFGYGRYSGTQIGQTLDDLLQSKCSVSDIPTITVSLQDGLWYSGDNRRLWVFRKCEELGIIDRVPAVEGYISSSKFTTYNKGVSIRVRGSPGGWLWTQKNRIELVIKDPEPPKPAEASTPVINTIPINDNVVHPQVQENSNVPKSELSEYLSDTASESDQSFELEPSQCRKCPEESDSCLENSSTDVKNSSTEGQFNPVFVGDEDDPEQQHMAGINDLVPRDDTPVQPTQNGLVQSDTGYVSVDFSSSEGGPISCNQPNSEEIQHSTLEIDTNNSIVSTEPQASVDVELGHKVRESCQKNIPGNCITLLSKYQYLILVILIVVAVFLIVLMIIDSVLF